MSLRPRPRSHAGFTMVELLVAMTLGLLLTIVIGQVFLASKEAYRTTEDLARLQENARFGVAQLSRVIRMTSYIADPLGNRVTIFPAGALAGVDGGGSAADEITVRYQGSGNPAADATIFDCHGNEVAAVNPLVLHAVARFYLAPGADGASALFCDNTGTLGVASVGPIELASGVENIQILYGEDTDPIPDGTANRYVARGDVTNLDNVVSLRIALLVRSSNEVASGIDTKTYNLAGTVFDPVDDRRLRRFYTATITLRNRAP